MTITYALMEKIEEISKTHPEKAKVISRATVKRILQDPNNPNAVIGVEYVTKGKAKKFPTVL